jgi:chorismate mutase
MLCENDVPAMQNDPNQILTKIREEIDDIDSQMHALLIKRSQVIDYLIKVKEKQGGGSAFRPGREAAMMKTLAQRHSGNLPLDTIESIWRIIIATFTFVQAPYNVHLDLSEDHEHIWDTARFHFGFTVPLHKHGHAQHVIEAVRQAVGDLGIVPLQKMALEGAWWNELIGPQKPKIIARLPFLTRTHHPIPRSYYVISKPLAEAMSREVIICAINLGRWSPKITEVISSLQGEIVSSSPQGDRLCSLIALPYPHDGAKLYDAFIKIGLTDIHVDEIGSHAAPFNSDICQNNT